MRVVLTEFMSIDGVTQGPGSPDEDTTGGFGRGGWFVPHLDEAFIGVVQGWAAGADAYLFGRRTYEAFARDWPNMPDLDDPVAKSLNTLPKYVVANSPVVADWSPTTVISGDVLGAVAELQGGSGSGAADPRQRPPRLVPARGRARRRAPPGDRAGRGRRWPTAVPDERGIDNPAHERKAFERLKEITNEAFVTASIEVNPEIMEYERTSTTVMNAMLGPRCGQYARTFERRVRDADVGAKIYFMQSNGGLTAPAVVSDRPVTLLEIGPGRRRHGGGAGVRAHGRRERDHRRHGRHQLRRVADPRRQAGGAQRDAAEELHGALPEHRHHLGRGRRRLARLGRRGRRHPCRARERRRRSGAGLLRPRRHAADRDRLQRHSRPRGPGKLPRRRFQARRRGGRARRAAASRRSARHQRSWRRRAACARSPTP